MRCTGLAVAGLLIGLALPAGAELVVDEAGRLKLDADSRVRLESDWDSRRADGTPRDDRTRLRLRQRLGLRYAARPWLGLELRARSGSKHSQQSPHVTLHDFDGNPNGDAHVVLDRWLVRATSGGTVATAGRMSFPFWSQNELLWDDDVTIAGGALSHRLELGQASHLGATAGWLALPDGMTRFNGSMAAGQLRLESRAGRVDLNAAVGTFLLYGSEGAEQLRNDNGARDYAILQASVRGQLGLRGRPLAMGFDLLANLKNDEPHLSRPEDADQRQGLVLQASWGGTGKGGDVLLGWWFAHIERLAVNASFAQDDWVRWGSATQTDGSDLEGHELRVGLGLGGNAHLLARLYLVEAMTSAEDGKRFRVDFNWKL